MFRCVYCYSAYCSDDCRWQDEPDLAAEWPDAPLDPVCGLPAYDCHCPADAEPEPEPSVYDLAA